jgi:hypothetical protein
MPKVQIGLNPSLGATAYVYDQDVANWRHRISTIGFDTAQFDVLGEKHQLDKFFYNELGKRVTRYGGGGHRVIWDGQIVEMVYSQPGLRQRISLRNMYNRVSVRYIPINTGTNPPTESAETSTAVANDTASQAKDGIKELVFRPPKINRLTDADAQQMRDTLLAFYRNPTISDAGSIGGGEMPGVQCLCEGYYHTLGWRVYNQTANSGTQDADVVVAAVEAAAGDFILSTSLSSNTTAVQRYFNRDNTAREVIEAIVALGDSGNSRWLAYVLEDCKLVYAITPSLTQDILYYRRMADTRQEIYGRDGRIIPNWEIRAGQWMWTTDIDPFRLPTLVLRDNPQLMLIESVEWDEEGDRLAFEGAKDDRAQMMIARAAAQGEMLL